MLHLTKYLYMLEYILVSSKHLRTKLYDGITLMMSLSWDGSLVYKFMLLAIFSYWKHCRGNAFTSYLKNAMHYLAFFF